MIDINYEPKELYMVNMETGEKHKLDHIKNIEINSESTNNENKYLSLNSSEEFSGVIHVKRSLVYLLDVRIGHKFLVPNNWLKRHKIPMNRRYGI